MGTITGMLSFPVPDLVRSLAHLSSAIGWTIAAACAIFWLAMLVDCLRRPAFYPILGTNWRTKIFWLLTFALLNPLMTLMYLLCGRLLPPRPKAAWPVSVAVIGVFLLLAAAQIWPSTGLRPQVLRFQRDPATGEMRLETGSASTGLSLNAAATESTTAQNSISSTSGNDESFFSCDHIAVLGSSEHPLMQKVAGLLGRKLGDLPFVKSVTYHPPGSLPPVGGRLPDMVVTLDAPRLDEADLSGYRELTCTIDVSAGQIPWSSRHHVMSGESPPLYNVNYTSRLAHRSRTAGITAGDARYQAPAKGIVEQIEGGFLKALGEWSASHCSPAGLPAGFYGQYTAPRESFFAARPGWQLVLSGTGMFEHNRTVWRFDDNRTAQDVLAAIKTQLVSEGFRGEDHDGPYLRMSKDEQVFEAYQLPTMEFGETDEASAGPRSFAAVYRLRFTKAERCRALEDLLNSAASEGHLLAFQGAVHVCPNDLADRLAARLADLPAASAQGLLAVAQWQHRQGKQDAARTSLRKAVALAWADGRKDDLKSTLEDLGPKLGMSNAAESRPSEEDLRETGIPQLSSESRTLERTLTVGESLRAWTLSASGDLCTVRCGVLQGHKAGEPFRLSVTVGGNSGSMTSTVGISPATAPGRKSWLGTNSAGTDGVRVIATAASEDGKHFKLTVQLVEDNSPASVPSATNPSGRIRTAVQNCSSQPSFSRAP